MDHESLKESDLNDPETDISSKVEIDDSNKALGLDEILEKVDPRGKWQISYMVVAQMLGVMEACEFAMGQYLLQVPKQYHCIDGADSYPNNCAESAKCKNWTYNTTGMALANTGVTTWNLYCSTRLYFALIESSFFMAAGFGVIILGALSDKFGRRAIGLLAATFEMLSGFATVFSVNIYMYAIARASLAFWAIGAYTTGFVLAVELVSPKYRSMVNYLQIIPDIIKIAIAALAFVVVDWRQFAFMTAAISFPIYIFLLFCLPESPRWAINANRPEKAEKFLKKIAARNKIEYPKNVSIHGGDNESRGRFIDLFQTRRLAVCTIEQCYSWFMCAMVFWYLAMNTSQFTPPHMKPQIVFILFAVSNIMLSTIWLQFLIDYFGRKPVHVISLLASALVLIISPFTSSWTRTSLGIANIAFITIAFGALYMRSSEILPTPDRNAGIGAFSFWARIGSMVFPFIDMSSRDEFWLPSAVYSFMCLVGAIMALDLPETNKIKLKETVMDTEKLIAADRGIMCCCEKDPKRTGEDNEETELFRRKNS